MSKMKKRPAGKRREVSPLFAILAILALSLFLTLFMFWLQPDGVGDVIKCIRENKGLSLFLNWLPVALAMFLFYFAGSNFVAAVTVTGFLCVIMSVVNRYKILLRSDPFLPWDISLGNEVAGIAKSFGLKMIISAILLILVYIVASILAGFVLQSKKMPLKYRAAGAAACILAMALLNKPLYKNNEINGNLYVIGNVYNQVSTFNSKGFLYSFLYTYNTNKIAKPGNYNAQAVLEKIASSPAGGGAALKNTKKPHIIMIMSEAFSEMALNPAFDFTGYTDPLENYKRIKAESLYGEIIVPNVGGGTADTEFDTLTGLSTRHLRGAPFAFRLVAGEFEAMPSILNTIGYRSEALHPGYAWFYNRQNVFAYFGFENSVFLDQFSEEQNKGMYINETATMDKLIDMYEQSLAVYPESPYYHFCVSIQNHGPYTDKYLVDTNFATTLDIGEDGCNAISNYFEGVKDQDEQLARLTEYFRQSSEPVVLIYYGDHLPAFTQSIYNEAYPDHFPEGSLESLTRINKTPFIIWQNDAAKELAPIEANNAGPDMPEDRVISSNYLGAYVLELLGYNEISPFMDYVNQLRVKYPVILETRSFTGEGEDTSAWPADEKQDLILYRDWEFYKIFDE